MSARRAWILVTILVTRPLFAREVTGSSETSRGAHCRWSKGHAVGHAAHDWLAHALIGLLETVSVSANRLRRALVRPGGSTAGASISGSELAPGVTLDKLIHGARALRDDARSRGDADEAWRMARALAFLEDVRDVRTERDGR